MTEFFPSPFFRSLLTFAEICVCVYVCVCMCVSSVGMATNMHDASQNSKARGTEGRQAESMVLPEVRKCTLIALAPQLA